MKTTNEFTKVLLLFGIFLAVFGISRFDLNDYSFENNERAYYMFIASGIFLLLCFFMIRRERKAKGKQD